MTTNRKKTDSPSAVETHFDAAIQAAEKLLQPAPKTYDYAGQSFTRDQLVSHLQDLAAPYKNASLLRSQLKATVRARKDAKVATREGFKALEGLVISAFGNQVDVLEQFGFAAPKPRTPLSAEQAHARSVKSAMTRKARGTMGRRQREALAAMTPPQVVFAASVVPGTVSTEPPSAAPTGGGNTKPATGAK